MTRDESVIHTKRLIRTAKSGEEIAKAIVEHLKAFKSEIVELKSAPDYAELAKDLCGPLFIPRK